MVKLGIEQKVGDALEEYYEKTGGHPPLWLNGEANQTLQPGEKVTLPAPTKAPTATAAPSL